MPVILKDRKKRKTVSDRFEQMKDRTPGFAKVARATEHSQRESVAKMRWTSGKSTSPIHIHGGFPGAQRCVSGVWYTMQEDKTWKAQV